MVSHSCVSHSRDKPLLSKEMDTQDEPTSPSPLLHPTPLAYPLPLLNQPQVPAPTPFTLVSVDHLVYCPTPTSTPPPMPIAPALVPSAPAAANHPALMFTPTPAPGSSVTASAHTTARFPPLSHLPKPVDPNRMEVDTPPPYILSGKIAANSIALLVLQEQQALGKHQKAKLEGQKKIRWDVQNLLSLPVRIFKRRVLQLGPALSGTPDEQDGDDEDSEGSDW